MSENHISIPDNSANVRITNELTRRSFLYGIGSIMGSAAVVGRFGLGSMTAIESSIDSHKDRPNIVFILADDLGWSDL